jgi:hypothetical protein
MRKKLFALKMAIAALVISFGVSLAPPPADAGCVNGYHGYLVCIYYIDNEWLVLIGPMLDL